MKSFLRVVPEICTFVSDQINQLVHTNCSPRSIHWHKFGGPLNAGKSRTVSSKKPITSC